MDGERDGVYRGVGVEVVDAAFTSAAHDKRDLLRVMRAQNWTPGEATWTLHMAMSFRDMPPEEVREIADVIMKTSVESKIEETRLQNALDLSATATLDRGALTTLIAACKDFLGINDV